MKEIKRFCILIKEDKTNGEIKKEYELYDTMQSAIVGMYKKCNSSKIEYERYLSSECKDKKEYEYSIKAFSYGVKLSSNYVNRTITFYVEPVELKGELK